MARSVSVNKLFNNALPVSELFELIGAIWLSLYHSVRDGLRLRINQREFWDKAWQVGNASLLTVILTSLSIGMVSSLQLVKHFAAYGALSSIGGANALAQIREMAPVVTSLVLIGRVGSAWAAEIGSMKMTDQLSALQVMKLSWQEFLITPRVLSCMLLLPALDLVALTATLTGGYLIADVMVGLSIHTYVDSIPAFIDGYDLLVTLVKSMIFGWLVAAIACFYGFQAHGGTIGVGRYTTKAVVAALLAIFVVNFVLSFVFYSLFG